MAKGKTGVAALLMHWSSRNYAENINLYQSQRYTDGKVHGVNMGPTWVLSAPDGPHVGPMNLAIWVWVWCNHWAYCNGVWKKNANWQAMHQKCMAYKNDFVSLQNDEMDEIDCSVNDLNVATAPVGWDVLVWMVMIQLIRVAHWQCPVCCFHGIHLIFGRRIEWLKRLYKF